MNRLYQFMNWPEIEGLVYSECSHPMELLGAHMCRDGMLVQVFRPDAVEAEIHIAGRKKAYACEKVDESGYFAVCIPIKKQTAYTVCIEDIKGQKKEYMDPYACGTALTAEQRKKLAAGDDWEAYRLFGAHERTVGGIRGVCFAVWAPNAQRVSVVGDFNHWDGRIFPMEKHEDSGIFELFIPEMKAGTAYKYEIKFKGGNIAVKTDPYCRQCDAGQGFASVVYADIPFAWEDGAWQKAEENRDIEKEPVAIYEISPETCRQIKEPEQFAAQIAKLGYTHIELQAVAQYDSRRRNLRETAGYFAPADIFGTPDDLKRLVNAMHKENIGVIADWNAAFMGNLPSGLTWFDGTNLYESSAFCLTPDADVAVSSFQYGKPQVKMFLISNAIMWIKEERQKKIDEAKQYVEELHKENPKVAAIMSDLIYEIEMDENKYKGQSILNTVENMKQECIEQVVTDFCVEWYAAKEDVMYAATHYKNGEIPNESVIKTNVNYTQYKEQQEKALPKFKYYAKLMAELKKTLDEEVKPLLNH